VFVCLRGMPCVHETFSTDSCKSIPISFDMSAYLFANLSADSNSYTAAEKIFVKYDDGRLTNIRRHILICFKVLKSFLGEIRK
jgi:hypothetical protein